MAFGQVLFPGVAGREKPYEFVIEVDGSPLQSQGLSDSTAGHQDEPSEGLVRFFE